MPVLVDAAGLQPARFAPLPAQMTALDRTHAAPLELMVAAVLDRGRNAARHALMLDPLTSSVCSLAEREDLTHYDR